MATQKSIPNYTCKLCDYTTSVLCNFNKHNESDKHRKIQASLEENKPEKYNIIYECVECNYTTNKKSNYDNHLKSKKHNDATKVECPTCNKFYRGENNLKKHIRTCKEVKNVIRYEVDEEAESESESETDSDSESTLVGEKLTAHMFVEFMKKSEEIQSVLMKQNEEYRQQILELTRQQMVVTNNMNNTTNNTTTNNQFNLNVFLNEKCKDAVNMVDFMDSLRLQVSDLEETGKLGYIDGITRIFVNSLNELGVYKRPFHCTDIKRETVYIKDKNTWEKENDGKSRLKNVINRISNLNLRQLLKWQEQNPEYEDVNSKKNDEYIHLSTQAIGCYSPQENERNTDKIMKNVLKLVIVDKSMG